VKDPWIIEKGTDFIVAYWVDNLRNCAILQKLSNRSWYFPKVTLTVGLVLDLSPAGGSIFLAKYRDIIISKTDKLTDNLNWDDYGKGMLDIVELAKDPLGLDTYTVISITPYLKG